jgi:hypothetical protein
MARREKRAETRPSTARSWRLAEALDTSLLGVEPEC